MWDDYLVSTLIIYSLLEFFIFRKVAYKCSTNTPVISLNCWEFSKNPTSYTSTSLQWRVQICISKFKYCKKLYSFYSCHACIDDVFFLLTFSHLLLLHSISLKYYFDRCIPLKSPYIYNKMRPHYTCLQVIKNSTPKYPLHTTYITLKI